MFILISLTSCNKTNYSQYIDKESSSKTELNQLFSLIETYTTYSENKFTVMNEIINLLLKDKDGGKLNLFITSYINEHPDDPYNSYYLLNLASYYLNEHLDNFAIQYLHSAVTKYKDLIIRGESTHFKALEVLLDISKESEYKILYYKKLIREHKDRVNKKDVFTGGLGELYYYLGKTLEENEQWEESIEAYKKYLEFEDTVISTKNDVREEIIKKVGFYYSDKKWVVNDLNRLVANVRYAISIRNPALLDKYRAFDFFIINWNSDYADLKSSFPMESNVLTGMSIKSESKLDPMSTDNEAYLAVYGNRWSSSIWFVYPVWYFYFKKVDFPMDPEIHGGWEWAGIFLGEKV